MIISRRRFTTPFPDDGHIGVHRKTNDGLLSVSLVPRAFPSREGRKIPGNEVDQESDKYLNQFKKLFNKFVKTK